MSIAEEVQHRPNQLLASLLPKDRMRLSQHLEPVQLSVGESLYGPDRPQRWVFFPDGAIVSLLYVMENGSSAEIATVGSDGVLGVSQFMGGGRPAGSAVVLSAGPAQRMNGEALRTAFDAGGALQQLLLRYTQALLRQVGQNAVCNRHHSIDQQLCRWLLMSLDRLTSNRLTMTHQLIADRLGVRRECVTEAAGNLQRAGAIKYHRGHIEVLDRSHLEARSCECYDVVRRDYARLLPWRASDAPVPVAPRRDTSICSQEIRVRCGARE
ncbi:MAG: Crp/Fnr family transcriptional regulator [Rhodanobacter sp.]